MAEEEHPSFVCSSQDTGDRGLAAFAQNNYSAYAGDWAGTTTGRGRSTKEDWVGAGGGGGGPGKAHGRG